MMFVTLFCQRAGCASLHLKVFAQFLYFYFYLELFVTPTTNIPGQKVLTSVDLIQYFHGIKTFYSVK